MTNIKVSDFSRTNGVNPNTFSTIFYAVDLQSQTSIAITANTLANTLFSNSILYANANVVLTNSSVLQFPDGTTMSTAAVGGGSLNLDTLSNNSLLSIDTTKNKFLTMNLTSGINELVTSNTLAKNLFHKNKLWANSGIEMFSPGGVPQLSLKFSDGSEQVQAFNQTWIDTINATQTQGFTTASDLANQQTKDNANNVFLKTRANVANANFANTIVNNNTFIVGTTTLNYKNLVLAGNVRITGNLVIANSAETKNVRDIGGTVSSVTINFLTDAIVRINTTTALTVTITNPTVGKQIDLIIVNINASGACTITHGCTALNSSTGNTTYSLLYNRSSLNRYICTTPDDSANNISANVFVFTSFNQFQ